MTAPANPEAGSVIEGTVIRSTGSWYAVLSDDEEEVIQARARGKFRLQQEEIAETNPLAVGDRVSLRMEQDGSGLITEIHARRNQLSRRAAGRKVGKEQVIAANVDAAWCVQATFRPKLNPGFVDRFLVMAEAYHLDAGLVINKIDLLEGKSHAEDTIVFWKELYEGLGYPVLLTCAITGNGVEEFGMALEGKTSVVAGPSGVGKTSLLNAIEPDLNLKTGGISEKTQKGKHTTTSATLHRVGEGLVVDTPGIREFGIWDMAPEELCGYYVEMRKYIGYCRFPDCTHDHEPGCAIIEAVDANQITTERYGSYLNVLGSLREEDTGR